MLLKCSFYIFLVRYTYFHFGNAFFMSKLIDKKIFKKALWNCSRAHLSTFPRTLSLSTSAMPDQRIDARRSYMQLFFTSSVKRRPFRAFLPHDADKLSGKGEIVWRTRAFELAETAIRSTVLYDADKNAN